MRSLKWASELLAGMLLLLSVPAYGQLFSIPGSFAVSPDGAATYTVPIQVPPGVAGMEPKLALSYNSQSGNGLLGVGWSLSGMSAITRCPRTLAQDNVRGSVNFDSNDRYCLDGQRLIAISGTDGGDGTEYRTERESFSKIISYGTAGSGPAYFIVKTKAGMTMEYGNTADSRIEAQGKTTVATWAQNRMLDTKGNFIDWQYFEDAVNGQWYPLEIRYTGSLSGAAPAEKVAFVYEQRPDNTPMYFLGNLSRNTVRISKVQTYAAMSLIGEYRLTYGLGALSARSRLMSVASCNAAGGCLLPVSFTWSTDGAPTFDYWTSSSARGNVNNYDHYFADVNGDGIPDWIQVSRAGNQGWVGLGRGDGTFDEWTTQLNVGAANDYAHYFVDVNGDGKADWIQISRAGNQAWVGLSNGDGTFQFWTSSIAVGAVNNYEHYFADVNGDGLPDWIQVSRAGNDGWVGLGKGDGTFEQWTMHTNSAGAVNNYAHYFVDVNGDGKADWIQVVRSTSIGYVGLSNGDGTFQFWTNSSNSRGAADYYDHYFADVNGDGIPDWIQVARGSNDGWVGLGKGDGSFDYWTMHTAYAGAASAASHYFVDVNGDGKADWIQVNDGVDVGYVGLSNGDGTFQFWNNASAQRGAVNNYEHYFVDVNGDGLPDWIQVSRAGDQAWVGLNLSGTRDIIVAINNGLSNTAITFKTLPQALGTQYFKEFSVSYPQSVVTSPLQVVTDVGVSNGIGGVRHTTYSYGTALADATGRGYLGFNWVQSQDTGTGIISRTTYHQDFPYLSVPSESYSKLGSAYLSNSILSYVCVDPLSGAACAVAPGKVYSLLNTQTDQQSWDLNGVQLPTMRTTQQYDLFGNATQVKTETLTPAGAATGYSKTTTSTYYNDTTNWYLGRLLRATTTSVSP